jgi:hypothetical protein
VEENGRAIASIDSRKLAWQRGHLVVTAKNPYNASTGEKKIVRHQPVI